MENKIDRKSDSPKRSPSRRSVKSSSPERKTRTPSKAQLDLQAEFPKAVETLSKQQKTYEGLLGP